MPNVPQPWRARRLSVAERVEALVERMTLDEKPRLAWSSADVHAALRARLVGPLREVGHERSLRSVATVAPLHVALDEEVEVMTA
jgi:hypothetical protein